MHAYSASRRLRTGLCSVIGQIYMVTSVTKGREPVFADFRLGRLLVKELRRCKEQELAKSLAWVVMPDHVHWLFELRQNDLPMLMRQLSQLDSHRKSQRPPRNSMAVRVPRSCRTQRARHGRPGSLCRR
ncbi:hypothetical protein ALO43_04809 [Pseudomonas tremae]|uniref:Transposase IS200-like domain-containing protein n=1 Tax=Pseudomonas tremae TaxID=200454 RepID=A0AA40P7R0_9PSED|nr:Uncharacterized protein ALO89_04814 [Pseudomonas coronafaciens pv. porri]KPZ06129.1 hypothetical protein ALO43_04809 [Pseudomonas tremae]RMS46149.1 hypothetical protein ALP71_01894 [Pseudomonas coronafaciens pv. garcae]RMW03004.1 hypothetical protein ALP00_04534 [Pseudomonas coronafaciens pv. porri]